MRTGLRKPSARLLDTAGRSQCKQRGLIRKNKPQSGSTSESASNRRVVSNEKKESDNSDSHDPSLNNAAPSSSALPVSSPMDATGLAPYGGGIGAVSPYGFYGGASPMMSPSPYMGMGMNTMGLPYLTGFNQFVYNIQNIIFSISQAIQVVGANQQALGHAWDSLNQMVDQAVVTFHEMRALEIAGRECETEEERQKRKRLKALRYAFVFGGSWLAYKLIRNLLFRKRSLQRRPQIQSTQTALGGNDNGQSNLNHLPMTSHGPATMPSYYSPSNIYGANDVGYSGYSGNYQGLGNGYY